MRKAARLYYEEAFLSCYTGSNYALKPGTRRIERHARLMCTLTAVYYLLLVTPYAYYFARPSNRGASDRTLRPVCGSLILLRNRPLVGVC